MATISNAPQPVSWMALSTAGIGRAARAERQAQGADGREAGVGPDHAGGGQQQAPRTEPATIAARAMGG
jgi:hypothetical protein